MRSNNELESEEKEILLSKKKTSVEGELDGEDDGYFHGDGGNVALLLFLYIVQGIPIGLTSAIPIILQNRNVDYSDQAVFSFSLWPFSLKILWAPILDVVYSTRFGKRKSWLIPSQILLALSMLFVSINFDDWMGDQDVKRRPPNIRILTAMFFIINFLTATQDIALDGWAITMLKRRNLGYVSTCTNFGQLVGNTVGYQLFILLNSADISNAILFWLRTEPDSTGILSFSTFIFFWAAVIFVTTVVVGILKKDNSLDAFRGKNTLDVSVRNSYKLVWDILKLKPVRWLSILFLTSNIGYAPNTEVSTLKIVENGFSRDKIALLGMVMVPIQIILLIVISGRILSPRQLGIYVTVTPYSMLSVLLSAIIVYVTSLFSEGNFPPSYYGLLLLSNGFDQLLVDCKSISGLAFIAKVSDPRCGATYMALMATMENLGNKWPSTVILWVTDLLTWKNCVKGCTAKVSKSCEEMETCTTYVDGFYVTVLPCILFGLVWWRFAKRTADYIHGVEDSMWLIDNSYNHQSIDEERTEGYNEIQGAVYSRSSGNGQGSQITV